MSQVASNPRWAEMLREAVTKPGMLNTAYRAFHNYSTGNQMLAMLQCFGRGIQPGPIATFPAWKDKGRSVKKGEKAIALVMPVTVKDKSVIIETDGGETSLMKTVFILKNRWFVLSQTEGEEVPPVQVPGWNKAQALEALKVQEVPFEHVNGNCLGYATMKREIAVSPLNPLPEKTTFHELAHIVLGHTEQGIMSDAEVLPKNEKEMEAEAVALLCLESLGLNGQESCRAYIQSWWGAGNAIPEKNARRIFTAADAILKAGQMAKAA